ncbi:MAG: hydroxymethylglutaryl-CoA lyase [Candidatus Bipolaricaulia bacterium]
MSRIRVTEVGPRDGLQNESEVIPTEAKVAFVNALGASGVDEIEVSGFVHPKWVPQLADAADVFSQLERPAGVVYSALVPNEKGLERALDAGVDKIAVFTAASETFNRTNINASIAESLERFRPVLTQAQSQRLPVRGYVSTAFHCPYEGKVDPNRVVPVVEQLLELGVDEVSIGDTIGKASPPEVRALLDVLMETLNSDRLVLHFHDTYGMAVANALAAWEDYGIARFDSSAGGLGGCPFAPGAAGNVATEDLGYALQASGADVAVDGAALVNAARGIEPHVSRALSSRLGRVLAASD